MTRRPSAQTRDVLVAFLESPDDWRYGYDMSRQLGISSGTLYPILMRLSDRGQLETRWSEPEAKGRPPRHMYRLTAGGRAWASSAVKESRTMPAAVPRTVGDTG